MREGISTVAVYFRDLDNGPWIGFNEKDRFTPASLYKIPIVFATLKEAIRNPEFLDMRMASPGLPQPEMEQYHYPPAEILEKGREYPVRDLLQRTLRYSDNGAAWMLHEAVGQNAVDAVLKDMGVNPERLKSRQSTLSPEEFARFFRVLYNASYLPPPLSEAILGELAQNPFAVGLIAGLPKDVAVAHKHGEKMKVEGNVTTIQLHDCGIVYHAKRPYLLSVMTKGNNYEAQAKVIADVSQFVYEEVTRRTL
jgi:beta-lactamase class A